MTAPSASSSSLPAATIVSGFLGAGKTTWLNRVLTQPRGLRVAVVVNDVGKINIDIALLSATQPTVESDRRTRPTRDSRRRLLRR